MCGHIEYTFVGIKLFDFCADGIGQVCFSNARCPIKEQRAIANYLDSLCSEIDSLSADIQKEIETLETYKKSIITEVVTKGLDKSAILKDSGISWIGFIPSTWKLCRMKHILQEKLAYGATETGIEYAETLPRYIRITDIVSTTELKEETKLSLPVEVAEKYKVNIGDVLFARSGATVGKSFLMSAKYAPAAYAGYLIKASVDKKKIIPNYLAYYTESYTYDIWKSQIFVQATIQNIGANRYNELPIPVPDMDQQLMITKYLDFKCSEIDSIISSKKHQIETLNAYKKSLIYEYVTGKKEVPTV